MEPMTTIAVVEEQVEMARERAKITSAVLAEQIREHITRAAIPSASDLPQMWPYVKIDVYLKKAPAGMIALLEDRLRVHALRFGVAKALVLASSDVLARKIDVDGLAKGRSSPAASDIFVRVALDQMLGEVVRTQTGMVDVHRILQGEQPIHTALDVLQETYARASMESAVKITSFGHVLQGLVAKAMATVSAPNLNALGEEGLAGAVRLLGERLYDQWLRLEIHNVLMDAARPLSGGLVGVADNHLRPGTPGLMDLQAELALTLLGFDVDSPDVARALAGHGASVPGVLASPASPD